MGFLVATPIFLAWMLTFAIGHDTVFPKSFADKVDSARLPLDKIGWAF